MTHSKSTDDRIPFAFVIPLVHPGGQRVSNYDFVEKSLHLTLTSLTSQTVSAVPVIIVCHKKPDWHTDFEGVVTFLVIPEHPWFSGDKKDRFSAEKSDRNTVVLDKGMKFLAGMYYAKQVFDPQYLMPMDADDFVRKDLIEVLLDVAKNKPESECFIISHGYHVPLQKTERGFELQAAFQVKLFDETCGTSRIFNSERFFAKLADFSPEIANFKLHDMVDEGGRLKTGFLDLLGQLSERNLAEDDSFMRAVGRHTQQDAYFNLHHIELPLAAKACGHGNHVGLEDGGIHWRKFCRLTSSRRFMAEFGLTASPLLSHSFSPRVQLRGLRSILRNKRRARI